MANQKNKTTDHNFMVQGAILGIASIIVRIIGLIYRVPLNNILGEKGVAYYGVAFDVYSIMLLLSSYSMPLAVSKMVSARMALKQYKNTRKILIASICFSFACGIVAFCITFFGADIFAKILNYPQSAPALRMLSFALLIMSVLGVLRGFFQGLGTMVPTAVSNIIEQIFNAIVSIVAAVVMFNAAKSTADEALLASNYAEGQGAAGGTLGTVIGALTGLIFVAILLYFYMKRSRKEVRNDQTTEFLGTKEILKIIVVTIIPVILSTTIYNIGSLLDSGIFSNIMAVKDMDQDTIDTLTGMYTGNYRLIINVPIALASALASSLIPSIVKSMTQKRRGEIVAKIDSSIKVMMVVAMPCAAGIGFLSKPIVNLLFPSSVDPDKVALMLSIGCISVVLYSLSTITNSMLQGIDHMRLPVYHSGAALIIHVVFLVLVLFIFNFNIFGVVIADLLFAFIVCFLNQRSLKKYLRYKLEFKKAFLMPALCSVIMGIVAMLVCMGIKALIKSNVVGVIFAIAAAVVVYAVLLFKLKVVSESEILSIPGGTKLIALARKFKLI